MDTYYLVYGTIFGLILQMISAKRQPTTQFVDSECYNPNNFKILSRMNAESCASFNNNFEILGWEDRSTNWAARSFENKVEISFHGGSISTIIKHRGEVYHLKATKLLITRKGSQHIIGTRRKNVEIQLYHKAHHKFGRQAFAFFVRFRNGNDNKHWKRLLIPLRKQLWKKTLQTMREVHFRSPGFQNFLFESYSKSRHTLSAYGKYKDNETPSCEGYTWRILKHRVPLSRRQIRVLHGGRTSYSRYIQPSPRHQTAKYCEDRPL